MDERQENKANEASYWLVVVYDELDKSPECFHCDSKPALITAIETHLLKADKSLYAFAFKGERIQLSTPRPVCSFTIDGESVEIGTQDHEFPESGHILPLKTAPD
jgi:hypothetical protein